MKTFITLKTFSVVVFVFSLQALLLNQQTYNLYAQTTAIPDVNFEQALIDLGIDGDGILNGQVLTSDIENVIVLNINNKNISDLTGIEGFTALEELNVGINQLSTVNLINNLNLEYLHIAGNQLSDIDLSNNLNLEFLIIAANPLPNIDLSANTALKHLNANGSHSLTSLDLSNNLQLEYLSIDDAWLSEIDLTNNTALKTLLASFNFFINIDLSHNINLEYIELTDNFLETLELSNNTLLKELYCGNMGQVPSNEISSLDLSNNPNLEILNAENLYNLTTLNLKNGSNAILTEVFMMCSFEGEPCLLPLTCVEVDDAVAANANQPPYSSWSIEANFVYSEDCTLSNPDFKSPFFFKFYPNPVVDYLIFETQNCTNCIAKLYSTTGKLLKTHNFSLSQNAIDVEGFNTGLYFIVVENEYGITQTQKFVKK
ncbi:MAG: T9SS type A sorting domain-containing protein [Flavobacteriaceae bacterium]